MIYDMAPVKPVKQTSSDFLFFCFVTHQQQVAPLKRNVPQPFKMLLNPQAKPVWSFFIAAKMKEAGFKKISRHMANIAGLSYLLFKNLCCTHLKNITSK